MIKLRCKVPNIEAAELASAKWRCRTRGCMRRVDVRSHEKSVGPKGEKVGVTFLFRSVIEESFGSESGLLSDPLEIATWHMN